MKKILSVVFLVCVFAVIGGFFTLRSLYVVPVMTYHEIIAAEKTREPLNSVSPSSFRHQMEFLKKRGYRVFSLDEYVQGIRLGKDFCCKSAVITFDDGRLNNYKEALEPLYTNRFPAAFFVIANYIGKPGQMTLDQLKEASQKGITIGSHTMNHLYLPSISTEQQIREIVDSKKAIAEAIGKPVDYLVYPIGGFSDEVKRIVRESGYKAAFTTNRGYDRFNHDLFELKRIRFKDTDSDLVLWMKLSGYYNLTRQSKASH